MLPHMKVFQKTKHVEKAETVAKMQKTVFIPSHDGVNLNSNINLPTRHCLADSLLECRSSDTTSDPHCFLDSTFKQAILCSVSL
jgi:hypothetical protein